MEATTGIESIEQHGEWFSVKTIDGKRLSTKRQDVVFAAQQLIGQPVVVEYTEKTSDRINDKTGRPFINRYLESVRSAPNAATSMFTPVVGSSSSIPGFSAVPAQQQAVPQADARGERMGRNNLAAAAVESIIQLSDGQPQTIQAILDGLHRWSETGGSIFAPPTPPVVSQPPQQFPVIDEDIPF